MSRHLQLVKAAEVAKTAQSSRNVRTEYHGIHCSRVAHATSVKNAIRAAVYRVVGQQYKKAFIYNGDGEYVCYVDDSNGKGIQIVFTTLVLRKAAAGL